MCVTPGSEFFWIGLALFLGLSALCALTLLRMWRLARNARSEGDWTELIVDNAPALVINGIWWLIVWLAADACGIV